MNVYFNALYTSRNKQWILCSGKLLISVNKDTYEELGLEGKPSLYSGKNALRYSKFQSAVVY